MPLSPRSTDPSALQTVIYRNQQTGCGKLRYPVKDGTELNGAGRSFVFADDHVFTGWEYRGAVVNGELHDPSASMLAIPGAARRSNIKATDGKAYPCGWSQNRPLPRYFSEIISDLRTSEKTYAGCPGLLYANAGLNHAQRAALEAQRQKTLHPPLAPAGTTQLGRAHRVAWDYIPIGLGAAGTATGMTLIWIAAASGRPQTLLCEAAKTLNTASCTTIVVLPLAIGVGLITGGISTLMAYCIREACCPGLRPKNTEQTSLVANAV
jgi:hypothetical protein